MFSIVTVTHRNSRAPPPLSPQSRATVKRDETLCVDTYLAGVGWVLTISYLQATGSELDGAYMNVYIFSRYLFDA